MGNTVFLHDENNRTWLISFTAGFFAGEVGGRNEKGNGNGMEEEVEGGGGGMRRVGAGDELMYEY